MRRRPGLQRSDRFTAPLHVDRSSRYVNDAALVVTPDERPAYRIALDPRTLAAPVVNRSRFEGSVDGAYTVTLQGRFGFDSVTPAAARIAFPTDAPWTVSAVPDHPAIAGKSLDIIASSASATCLSHAEVQIGSAAPIALAAKQLDAKRVELRADLAGVAPGPAQVRFYEDDPRGGRTFETAASVAIQPPPANVDAKSAVAALGDAFIRLTGTGFERVRGVLVDGATYIKAPNATASRPASSDHLWHHRDTSSVSSLARN